METWLFTWKSSPANLNLVRSCDSDVTKCKPDYLPGSPALQTWIQSEVVTVTTQNGNLIIYLEVQKLKPDYLPKSPALNPVRSSDSEATKWKPDYLPGSPALQTWIQSGVVTVMSQNGNQITWKSMQTWIQSGVVTLTSQNGNQITWKSSPTNLNPVLSCDSDVTKRKPDYTWKSSPANLNQDMTVTPQNGNLIIYLDPALQNCIQSGVVTVT